NLIAVKSLNANGEGLISSLITGIEYVVTDHDRRINSYYADAENAYFRDGKRGAQRYETTSGIYGLWPALQSIFESENKKKPKAVVNMSIGGIRSSAVNFAVRYATEKMGIHFATAAGNESGNACDFSPASSLNAITVGASGPDNEIANFSNIGPCVDLYAPGVEILSAWPGNAIKFASGTSMASPHVAGVIAVYLSVLDLKPKELRERIIKDSINTVNGDGKEGYSTVKKLHAGFEYILEEKDSPIEKTTKVRFWP
ncbi:cerevisin, partial [Pancytospora epiphaga]